MVPPSGPPAGDPPRPRSASADASDGTEGPSVGNVLGFSLLFRERKALLALNRRGLSPGVRVRDYEAEIPNVAFPLKGALQAARFRHRRCRAVQATLVVETRALQPWIEARLAGQRLAKLRVDEVDVDLRATVPGARTPRPVLGVGGRASDGSLFWFQTALRIEPAGRHLRLRPTHQWLFGDLNVEPGAIWREVVRALREGCLAQPDGSVLVDVARLALTGPFVRTGWKAPDLTALGIETVALGRRSITVELREHDGEEAVPVELETEDPIGDMLARVHAHREEPGALEDRLDLLRQIATRVEPGARARLACATWSVQLTRYHDRSACLVALREWLDVRPSDRDARRLLATTLGRAGYDQELARLLVADRRAARTARHSALLDLALATLLVERLDEPRSALALLRPLVQTLREPSAEALDDLLPRALVVLAQARVVDAASAGARAGHAQQALDEAIAVVEARDGDDARPWRRADMRAAVARTFARHGELRPALALMGRALADDPQNDEHLDLAIELSLGLGERASAVDLLRIRIDGARRSERMELRRRLLGVLAQMDDPAYLAVTREEVERTLEIDPDEPEVLRLAARVERRADNPGHAAEYLARVAELEPDLDRRLDLELERAQLLDLARLPDAAWDAARAALRLLRQLDLLVGPEEPAKVASDPRVIPTLELALELAPPTARGALLDDYIHNATGEALGRALLERAETQIAHTDKIADLTAAAHELEDPSAVLQRIENLAGLDAQVLLNLVELAESRGAWAACASALARLGQIAARDQRFEDARRLFARALELQGDRLDWRLRWADSLEASGDLDGALEQLERVLASLPDDRPTEAELPIARWDLARRIAGLASGRGDDARALGHLELARAALERERNATSGSSAAKATEALEATCDELFDVLYRLGQTEQAEDLAAQMLSHGAAERRPHWLVQAAIVATGEARLARLEEASVAAPDDPDVADALEAELRARGLDDQLRAHLRRRLERADSPGQRAAVLERLIAVVDVGGQGSPGADELAELHAELLALQPDHVGALVALAELRQLGGAEQEALMLWRRAAGLLAEDDPRMFAPALRLGRQALRDEVVPEAEHWFRRAVALRPDDHDALLGLHEVGEALGDPRTMLDAASGLLARTEHRTRRAELELECAQAHIALEEGALAFDRLKRAAAETEPRSALHLEIAEVWLDLARRRGNVQEEGRARGQLRRALGPDLPSEALHDEIRLLADELGALDEALDLVAVALVRHAAARTTLALLERLTDEPARWPRRLEILRAVIDQIDDAGARDRAATLLISSAHAAEDASLVLLALDRTRPETAETAEHLEARRWAIARLGRVEEERAEIEARLSDPNTPLSSSLVTRFRDCFAEAESTAAATQAAARLVELAAGAAGERGARLAEVAFGIVETTQDAALAPEAALAALGILAPRGEVARARWQRVEDAVFDEGRADRIARLSELAAAAHLAGAEHLAGRARELLERGLELAPGAASLHTLMRQRIGRAAGKEGDPGTFAEALRARLDAVARRRALGDEARAALFIASAAGLEDDLAVAHLRARAVHERDAPAAFEPLVDELERRRAWLAVVELRALADEASMPAQSWVSLALRARTDAPRAEMLARGHAGRQLLASGEIDAAVEHLRRALEIDPEQPPLALTLGRALSAADRRAEALEVWAPLADAGPSAHTSGIDFPTLYFECGSLAAELGDLERAAAWLVKARRQAPDRPELRREAAEALYDALVRLDRRRDAARLAEATAEEHFTDLDAAARWLRRAADQFGDGTDPAEELRLLRRLRDLDPGDEPTLDRLQATLERTGDEDALIELLRQRLTHVELDDSSRHLDEDSLRRIARLEASLAALDAGEDAPDAARAVERLALLAVLARHDEDPLPTRLTMAQLELALGHHERAARLRVELIDESPDDPRVGPAVLGVLHWAVTHDEPQLAATMARRAHALGLDDLATLAATRRIGQLVADPELIRIGAGGLLERAPAELRAAQDDDGGVADVATLALDLANALADLGEPQRALAALERGAAATGVAPALHGEIVDRWLALLETVGRDAAPVAESEAKARAHLRRRLGPALSRADRLAEIELLLERLERIEPAIALTVEALALEPEDDELRLRLRRACARSEATDRYPRALRDVVDRLPADAAVPGRDRLLMELARAAHEMEGARTTLRAVDELSEQAAAESEMLDLRDWAVRKLGRVDDELAALEARLVQGPPDPLAVTRLWRTLESDAERTARRLLDLRARAEPPMRPWLALRALGILADRAPAATEAWLEAFDAALAERDQAPTAAKDDNAFDLELRDAWRAASRNTEFDTPEHLVRLAALARTLDDPELADDRTGLLRTLVTTYPDHAGGYRELVAGLGDPMAAAAWVREQGASDEREVVDRRLVGLSRGLEIPVAASLLGQRLLARPVHQPTVADDDPLVARLHELGALTTVAEWLERGEPEATEVDRDAWAAAWHDLAEAAARTEDPGLERNARLHAARLGRDRDAVIASLRRGLELEDTADVRRDLSVHLEGAHRFAEAADMLAPLASEDPSVAARAGHLAEQADQIERAIDLWAIALADHPAHEPVARREELASRTFAAMVDHGRRRQALDLALGEAERATGGDAVARWLMHAADLPTADLASHGVERTSLLRRAMELDPGRPGLAEAFEAALEAAGDLDGLRRALAEALGRGQAPTELDPVRRDRRLRRWLELVAERPPEERREALEVAVRYWPDETSVQLELAEIRDDLDDRDGALEIWARLSEQVEDGPAFYRPAVALAERAERHGDHDEARRAWERALRCDPESLAPWHALRSLAAHLDDPSLALRATRALIEHVDVDVALELRREEASALERLRRPREAAEALAAAAALAAPGSGVAVAICERWLELVSNLEADGELDARALAHLEAQARAALREALGDDLPAAALRAEARLLATRLDAADEALLLVRERILATPANAANLDVLADLTDELGRVDERFSFLHELAALVEQTPVGRDKDRLREQLVLAAKERSEPEVALRAVDALGPAAAERPRMVEIREWAVRRTGRTDEEIARLVRQLREIEGATPDERDERLRTTAGQVLRLFEGDAQGWAHQIVTAARARNDGGSRALVVMVCEHAEAEGGISVPTRLDAVDVALHHDAAQAVAPSIEALYRELLDEQRPENLRRALVDLERHGMTGPDPDGDPRVDRLVEALWGHAPGDPTAHRIARQRLDDGEVTASAYFERVEAYARAQSVSGAALGQLWTGAARSSPHDRVVPALTGALERSGSDDAAAATLLKALESLGAYHEAVRGWLDHPRLGGRDDLERLLDATAHHPALQAAVANRLADDVAEADPSFAAELYALALDQLELPDRPDDDDDDGDGDGHLATSRAEIRRRLGLALAETGRAEAALEHLLPLVEPTAESPVVPDPALSLRVADLLIAGDRASRALPLLEAAWKHPDTDDATRAKLPRRLWSIADDARARGETVGVDPAVHAEAYALAAQRAEGKARVEWLYRASELAPPERRVALLKQAARLAPDDAAINDALAGALRDAGESRELETLLRRRLDRDLVARSTADDVEAATATAVATAKQLLGIVRPTSRVGEAVALHEIILRLDPRDVECWLDLGQLRLEAGDKRGAEAAWAKIAELTSEDDDRSFEPVLALSAAAAARGDDETALGMLERALEIRPGDRRAWALRLEYGERFERPDVVLAATQTLLSLLDTLARDDEEAVDADTGPLDVARLERARATAFDHLGDPQAHRAWARANEAVEPGTERHEAFARAWIESAGRRRHEDDGARLEAEARAALREAVVKRGPVDGEVIAACWPDIAAEVDLLATVLESPEEALDVVEHWLSAVPNHPRLLETVKELSLLVDGGLGHVGALERALAVEREPAARDTLATELAYASVELVDPERLLRALDEVSEARANAAEMLDLREWAVRQLGRVDDELDALERALTGDAPLEATISRLLRMLDGDPLKTARRVLEVARRHQGPRRAGLLDHVLELAISADGRDTVPSDAGEGDVSDDETGPLDLALETLEFGVAEEPAFDPMRSLRVLEQAAFAADDPTRLANLAAATLVKQEVADGALAARGEELLGLGFLRYPDAHALHRVVLRVVGAPDGEALTDDVVTRATERLSDVAIRSSIRGHTAARLWSGFAQLLDRPQAAQLLAERAEIALRDDPDAFSGLLDALQDRKHWPDVMRLLELRMASSDLPEHKVEALKQLAHIRADILGDQPTAIRQLEAALEFAPRDPDLLLPLLDHHFGQRDLGPAIDLSVRVLDHVPMGDMAFTALGHRAADAALARGEHERAERLLERVLERVAEDARTQARLDELRAMADDAEHRVRMLGAIANRQTGNARIDALEERARLLVDRLGRPDDAIADLEAVHEEAPERRESVQLLDELYVQRERWSDLVALLEHDYPRHAGRSRAEVLERVAGLYSERLFDLGQAERALRLALEQLGVPTPDSPERALSDRLHLQMTRCLELQGRYEELAALLEHELSAELADERADQPPAASRIELLAQLARILRDYVEDEARAARVYEYLERNGHLPEEGLATLARWYRAQHRHEDLVRVLIVRSKALGREGDNERKAELDRRIGELLDGPLRRPHEAARYFLDAYLANPDDNFVAGNRARVLLAGTDSVIRVRQAILDRLPDLDDRQRAFGLVLLAEILSPQESFETEAEHRFEEALDIVSDLGPAHDGLGRLRARQGRLEDAVGPLVAAATSEGLEPERAADTAAVAARALLELHRASEAEAVLKAALERHPQGQRALLELARLYSRTGRRDDEAKALDELSSLSLSSMLRAEVAYRRAMLLEPEFSRDAFSEAGEEARAFLLEAVGADAMHAQARQVLLDLASARSEWSIVAHMYFLTVRELPPGPSRALTHLDLAGVYLDKLHDAESATRNLASALSQPTTDLVVRKRANGLAGRLPDPDRAAAYLIRTATDEEEIDDNARARLLVAAAELHLRGEDPEAGERALRRARELPEISEAALASVDRVQEMLGAEDFELKKERTALLRLLEGEDHAVERLHILSRLCEIARALPDAALLETSSRQLIELAHGMLSNPAERESAVVALRDLFAERGDFGRLVSLYEELAGSTQDAGQAANMLVDAARFAWTGVRDGKLAVAILGRALRRQPTHPLAIALLGDMAAAEDLPTETAILDELSRLDAAQLDPRLVLRLAGIAGRLGRSDRARQIIAQLLTRKLGASVEFDVLGQLDRMMQDRGEVDARLDVLSRRLELARNHAPDQVDGLAVELARAQMAAGSFDAARQTCTRALEEHPQNTPLAVLYAELLERNEDWPTLARLLEHLGTISIAEDDKARWFTRAARVHLDHDEDPHEAMSSARRLLIRARETGPRFAEARSTMIPLSFAEQRWDEVLELSIELRALRGDEDEALLFGAVTEALVHGRRTIARSIGPRHGRHIRQKLLWPAVARVCEEIAQRGPLPRLDAVLGATAALTGTTEEVRDELSAWTAGRTPRAGTSLALARANEALGKRELGQLMYQLAGFMAPAGPVPGLVERLPELPPMKSDPLHDPKCVPLAWRSALRELLIALREFLAGIRASGGHEAYPKNAIERSAVQTAGRELSKFREPLGMTIPVRITDDPLYAGVGIRNHTEPTVVVSEELTSLPDAERAFRLAMAAGAIATGLAMVTDTHPLGLGDLLDAIARLADPEEVLASSGARYMADALAARGLRASEFDAELRATLAAELKHWRRDDRALDQLVTTIRRATTLLATRLSGRLDGALLTLARDQGVLIEGEVEDGRRVLGHDDAQWLLRELGLQS